MSTTIVLTRRDLYDRVWSTPMVKLAPEFGMSAPGFAKLCKRNGIPLPGSGHWMITKAGYEIERDPLPTDPPPEAQIQITGDPRRDEEEHPDVSAQIVYEAEHPIVVPDHLNRPRPLVARTKEFLQPRRPDAIGPPRPEGATLSISVSPKQLPRALRIFDSLLKACEERGFSVVVKEERGSRVRIRVHGEELSVKIDEPNRRTDHVLTAREEEDKRKGKGWWTPRYDFAPTGLLVFTIDEWTEKVQHRWSDRKKRALEACLNDVIVGMVRIAVTILKPRRLEAERQHQRWLEEERRRQIYWAKMESLKKNLEEWQKNQELRAFIAAVDEAAKTRLGSAVESTPVQGWLRWARELAERGDPLNNFIDQLARQEESL